MFANRIKRFYSVENLVEKPVGEQDKTDEFSLSCFNKFKFKISQLKFARSKKGMECTGLD